MSDTSLYQVKGAEAILVGTRIQAGGLSEAWQVY